MPTVDVSLPQGPGYAPEDDAAAPAPAPRGPGYTLGAGETIFRPWGTCDPALMTPSVISPAHVVPAGSASHNARQIRKLSILSNAVVPSLKGVSYTLDLKIGAVGWLQNVRVDHLVAMKYIAEDARHKRARARAAAAARAGADPAAVRAAGRVVPEDDDGDVSLEAAENGFATYVYDRFTCLCPVQIAAYAYPRLYHEVGMCGLTRVCRTPGCEHARAREAGGGAQ